MLRLSGRVLGVESETVTSRDGSFDPFTATTVHVVEDGTDKVRVTEVRIGRDFPVADLPRRDDDVTLGVFIFKGRLYADSLIESSARTPGHLAVAADL